MKVFTYIKNHSSRVPSKNFQVLGDKPLWRHLIDELSGLDVYIDSDSDLVLDVCKSDPSLRNTTAYPRDKAFVDMEEDPNNKLSPSLLMIENFLNNFVKDPEEIIVLTHVTSPFLKLDTIKSALEKIEQGYEFVHSVYSIQDFAFMGKDYVPLNFDVSVVQRTQDVEKVHFSNGAFFMFRKKSFLKYNNRIGDNSNTFYYELPKIEAIEIDTQEDLALAKILYKGLIND